MSADSEEAFLSHLSESFRLRAMRLDEMRNCVPVFDLVSYTEAVRRNCAALRSPQGELWLVLADPQESSTVDWLEEVVREPFSYRIVHKEDLKVYLAQQEERLQAMDEVAIDTSRERPRQEVAEEISIEAISDAQSPVVKLLTSTFWDALKMRASDIHLETSGAGLAIKYRMDGVLTTIKTVEGVEFADQIISRIKVISELDIAERRIPQDGRFRAIHKKREIDFRVSVMPSVFGEDAVLRILDKRSLSDELKGLTLEQLGLDAKTISSLRTLSAEPHGMLLVTGPTGSGKTTTLYAALSEMNKGDEKIVTIEDPVEYQLPGVLQIPVNEKKGLTFARGLRSILRHDPDRIMVGEIRDPETAEIAVQSALTGHLVYTTVHANNVFDVIGRFAHMGADSFNLASALNAVMAQRLVRLVCSCRAKGCANCAGTGYRGRKAIAELLVISDDFRDLIASRAPLRRLKEAAGAAGMGRLRDAAIGLVERGETTQEEVDRVVPAAH